MPTSIPATDRPSSPLMGGLMLAAVPIVALIVSAVVTTGSASPKTMALVLEEAGRAVACAEAQNCARPTKAPSLDLASTR